MYKVKIDTETFKKNYRVYNQDLYESIDSWCYQNCQGDWQWHETTMWRFELESDAMAFKLRWA